VLSSEASEILGNFLETLDFPKIPEKCPKYPELLNLTASFWVMGINTPHPLPFVAAGSPHEKHISTTLLSPPISSVERDLRTKEIWVRD
jgi:hypothetical protein